jgi:dipeptidyl aminopeptidase/acylaminoacyl peptidase
VHVAIGWNDDHEQPLLWLPPPEDAEEAPLLVLVHSWSFGYLQNIGIPFAQWAEDHGWGLVAPQFRGPFDGPEATGSDLAVQDVVDAIDFALESGDLDADRVYVIGVSGGGMMSLLMAGRHPERFSGAAAWVPIHNLVQWYRHNAEHDPDGHYVENIADSCGGDPLADQEARAECEHRSPEAHLGGAREADLPIYIAHGLDDDVVPPSHAVWAYNQLADPDDRLGQGVVRALGQHRLPNRLDGSVEAETYFRGPDPEVHFARRSGPVTLVVFEGEHDMAYHPGLEWIAELAGRG